MHVVFSLVPRLPDLINLRKEGEPDIYPISCDNITPYTKVGRVILLSMGEIYFQALQFNVDESFGAKPLSECSRILKCMCM